MISYLKKYTSNPLVVNYLRIFSVDVLVKASGIILLPVYLKLMTQEEYGRYGYLFAIISTFSLVFNVGTYAAQSRLYHDYQGEKRGAMLFTLNAILLVFIVSLITIILLFDIDYPVVDFLFKSPFDYNKYRSTVLLAVVISVYSSILVNYYLTSEDLKKIQMFNILRIFLINGCVLIVLFLDFSEDNALARLKYATYVELVIILFFIVKYVKKMKMQFDTTIAKRTLTICLPIVISAILGVFINLSDRYFIERYGSLKDMSVYNLALSIAGLIPFIYASFQNIWLPQFLKQKDVELNRARSRKMFVRLLIFFIGISISIIVGLKFMLLIKIIDRKYEEIILLLPFVLLASIVSSLTHMFSNHLVYFDKLYLIIIVGVPIALIAVGINDVLVPRFNIYGAALASIAINSCYLISYSLLSSYFYRKKILK